MSTAIFNNWKNITGTKMQTILQVVQTVKTDTFSTTPNGTWVDITGMSVSITPYYSTSKILVIPVVNGGGLGTTPKIRILRDSTTIAVGDTAGSRQSATFGTYNVVDTNQTMTYTHFFLDNPATTSIVAYKLQVNNDNAVVWYCNRSNSDTNSVVGGRFISTFTVMEIAQ